MADSDESPARLARTRRVIARLMPYVRPYRGGLALAALATLFFVAVEVVRPWPIKVVIDQVILEKDWDLLPEWLSGVENATRLLAACCVAVLSLAALNGLLNYFKIVLLATAGQRVVAKLREDLHTRLLKLSLAYHGRQRSGDLFVRVSGDTLMMRSLLVEGMFSICQEALMVLGVLAVMAWLDWQIALVAALVVPLVIVIMVLFGRRLRAVARKQRKKEGQIGTAINESLASIPVIQAYSLEERAAERFSNRNRKSLAAGLAGARLKGKMSGWTEISIAIGRALTLLLGVVRVRQGALSPGEFIVLWSYVGGLYKPLRKVVTRSTTLFKGAACGERVLDVLDASVELPGPENPASLSDVRGVVRFESVEFSYDAEHRVLDGVDLELAPGECVGVVGANGSGKTTLASLVPRLRDVTAGRVLVDGHDVRNLDVASLRRAIAVVFQDTILFDATLRENIRLGRPDATDAEVDDVAARAGVTRFAALLQLGLETPVGERGVALSGGQRQRIALARALLRDAAVFVLDEPTTALDAGSADHFVSDLLASLAGKTVLLISHDERLLSAMDRIVRIDKGRVTCVQGRGAQAGRIDPERSTSA